MPEDRCKFCDSKISVAALLSSIGFKKVECPLCGFYHITDSAYTSTLTISPEDKILLSGYIRNNSTKSDPIKISINIFNKIGDLVKPYKNLSIDDRINLIIRFMVKNTVSFGKPVNLQNTFTAFFFKTENELLNLLEWMEEFTLIKFHNKPYEVILDVQGWLRYEQTKEINPDTKKVFIAMSLDKDMDDIYFKAIKPACEECNFDPVRLDLAENEEKISGKIIAAIKESRFLIADFTGQKHDVYFEAGFAQGLGLKVILVCKKGEEDKLHFDIKQYNYILWNNYEDLRIQLLGRIKTIIADSLKEKISGVSS